MSRHALPKNNPKVNEFKQVKEFKYQREISYAQ